MVIRIVKERGKRRNALITLRLGARDLKCIPIDAHRVIRIVSPGVRAEQVLYVGNGVIYDGAAG